MTVFSLPVIGLVIYFVSLIAGMVVRRSQSEIAIMRSRGITRRKIAIMRSRGITRRKIVNLYLLEGLLIGGLGLAGGLLVGQWMAQQILYLFRRIADRDGTTVLIATHDLAVDAFADEVVHLQDGRVVDRQAGGGGTRTP